MASLAVLCLGPGEMAGVHVVPQYEGEDADVDGHGEGVGDGDPQVSVDVEQNHSDYPSSTTEPAIGLVQVLEEEEGEESGSYEEEAVHGVFSLEDGSEQEASGVNVTNFIDVLLVLNVKDAEGRERDIVSEVSIRLLEKI